MNILALDLGTKTGYATAYESGVEVFHEETLGGKLARFTNWLSDQLLWGLFEEGVVVYEMPHFRGGPATRLLLGMAGIVEATCAKDFIRCKSVHSATLKKWATGNGRASKDEMRGAAQKFSDKAWIDDNEVDAYLIMRWAQETFKDE